ncbi:MAG: MBL fold metallo-hydrolase [Hyphomicrobiaceae bacterium]|nr:MBL fold metallo-hydrolase [Hyphomicrobiaceae bacterium]
MSDIFFSRRNALLGAGALAGASLGNIHVPAAEAKAPPLKTQVPYFYRFSHGTMQVTMVSDGPLPLGEPGGAFLGASKEEIGKLLTDNFLSPSNVVLEQNSPVINTGKNLVLFDTGMGVQKMFGPTTGRLLASLAEAGIRPAQIDSIVITHAHIDHIGGMVDAKNRRLFPNAQVYISQADFDFWTDDKDPKKNKDFVAHARKNLLPYRDRIKFIKDGEEFLPGITAMSAPGHTVGHTIFMIQSEGKQLCFIGDLTHHQVLLVERPRLEFAYDTDPKQSAETRVKMLTMLAEKKIPLLAYHFPWPGYGYVAKHGDGFRYHAVPMEIVKIPPKKEAAAPAKPAEPAKAAPAKKNAAPAAKKG